MSPETLTEIIKQLAPADYNNIIIDNASAIKKHIYCYINAAVQRVEYHTQRLSVAINSEIKKALEEILACSERYVVINPSLIELMKSAPSINTESLLTSAKKKVNELMNRGREVDHHLLTLNMEDNRLTKQQPTFAIKDECTIRQCEDSEEMVGILSYFTPEVIDKQTSILRCLTGEIEGLKLDIQDGERRRMLTHINGIDSEDFDSDLLPYIDIVRDKVGEDNAIEDYFYQLIPCYTFTYRNVLTSELHTGILHGHGSPLRPAKRNNQWDLLFSPIANNLWTSMKDSMKGFSHFIGSISRSNS
ncbi:MAG: hypothetical protein IIY87_02950, partial [Bacteroidales bacterium]|nr:hypothetical protein [Bacteroidales bacterium]